MVAALFTSDGALPFDLMLVYPEPPKAGRDRDFIPENPIDNRRLSR